MCGCECCNNGNPTCFDPDLLAGSEYHAWACKCSCGGCIARVIRGAINTGYLNGCATSHANAVQEAEQRGRDEGVQIQMKIDLDIAREDVWDEAQRDMLGKAIALADEYVETMRSPAALAVALRALGGDRK